MELWSDTVGDLLPGADSLGGPDPHRDPGCASTGRETRTPGEMPYRCVPGDAVVLGGPGGG